MGAAGRLPGAADGHDRCRRVRRSRPGPGSPSRWRPPATRSPQPAASRTPAATPAAERGRTGRAVLADLLPARRPRYSARKVKCSTSRYHVRDHERGQDRPGQSVRITRVQTTIRSRPRTVQPAPPHATTAPRPPPALPGQQEVDQVTRIMASQPGQDWSGQRTAGRRKPRTCSPSSPSGPASASSPDRPRPVRPAWSGRTPALPPAAPDRDPGNCRRRY